MISPNQLQVICVVLQRAQHAGIVSLAEQLVVEQAVNELAQEVVSASAAQPAAVSGKEIAPASE